MENALGPWLLITVLVPYFVATGLQDTHPKLGFLIASAIAGGHIVIFGVLGFIARQRKVFPYVLEVGQVVMYPILCGISYADDDAKDTIVKYYNFIALSVLAGVSVLSLAITYPLLLAHVQELVPWMYNQHEDVLRVGYQTTSVFCGTCVSLCLLYIVPIAKDKEDDHMSALNLVFRLILPTAVLGIVVIVCHLWARLALSHLWVRVADLSGATNPAKLHPEDIRRPRVHDPAMFAPPIKPAVNPYEIPPHTNYLQAANRPAKYMANPTGTPLYAQERPIYVVQPQPGSDKPPVVILPGQQPGQVVATSGQQAHLQARSQQQQQQQAAQLQQQQQQQQQQLAAGGAYPGAGIPGAAAGFPPQAYPGLAQPPASAYSAYNGRAPGLQAGLPVGQAAPPAVLQAVPLGTPGYPLTAATGLSAVPGPQLATTASIGSVVPPPSGGYPQQQQQQRVGGYAPLPPQQQLTPTGAIPPGQAVLLQAQPPAAGGVYQQQPYY